MELARPHSILRTTFLLLIMAVLCPLAHGTIIYVDAGARGSTGASWQDALNSLQDALLLAQLLDRPLEIRVAQGVYRPDRGLGIMPGDRAVSFALLNGVTIKGGYAGGRRLDPDARDIGTYETILSGDIGAPDQRDDNSYHVVTGSGTDSSAVLDGCTITAANGETGGGMVNDAGSPTVIDCTFRDNVAVEGAALHNINDSRPVLNGCVFFSNAAAQGGGAMHNVGSSPALTNCTFAANRATFGGAMVNYAQSCPALTSCVFRSNMATGAGGALGNSQSNPMLAGCSFEENSTEGSGGAVVNEGGKPIFLRCIFRVNSAGKDGGAVYSHNGCQLAAFNCLFIGNSATVGGAMQSASDTHTTLTNCTLTRNSAEAGGALHCASGALFTMANCILWGDRPEELDCAVDIVCSNIEGLTGGTDNVGNMSADPLFTDPNGDYHLKSQAGRWDPAAERWVIDAVSSPCIDAGDPDDGTGFEPFPHGNRINMGAYGGTFEASLSPVPLSPAVGKAVNPIPADGAIDVSTDVVLSWTADPGAVAHDVYLGIDFDIVTLSSRDHPFGVLASIAQTGTTFSLAGDLAKGESYYWRVDELDSQGNITKGDVWAFKTPPPPVAVGKAVNPIPADGAITVNTDVVLAWTAGAGAVAHDVYFGTTFDKVAESGRESDAWVSNQSSTSYDPGSLGYEESYYWRIDELDSQGNVTKGDVWSFKTPPPSAATSKASHPIPADGSISVSTNVILSWTAGVDAVAHDVHFGATFDQVDESSRDNPAGVLVSMGQSGTSYAPPGSLATGAAYYWRIDEIDRQGNITKGDVWKFTTTSGMKRACFLAQTPVWANGVLVPISRVCPAQSVDGVAGAANASESLRCVSTVEQLQEHEGTFTCYDVWLDTGNRITVASGHYFMSERGRWTAVQNLRAGTRLRTASGSVGIAAVCRRPRPYVGTVYNLKIKDSDCYLVGKDALMARDY